MSRLDPGIRVGVVAAMRRELRPIVKRLGLRPEPLGAGRAWRGRAGSREVVAVVTSMGTEAATLWTNRLLDAARLDHVVVVGIAGGVAARVAIGDLLNPETVLDERTGATVQPTPLAVGEPRGLLLTTDTLHQSPAALERLRREGILAVDMETAAVGAVAEARGLPWSVLRAVSDRAGDPRIDRLVVGLARPDGTPDPAAIARFVLTRPWRMRTLAALGRGMNLAIRVSTGALLGVLGAPPDTSGRGAPLVPP